MRGDSLNLLVAAVSVAASIVISYYFYRRSRKERQPVYVVTGNPVVRTYKEHEIVVFHAGSEVPVVTRTVVTLWNAGQEPIRRADIVENHELYVQFSPDTNVLDALVVATTRSEIDFTCAVDREDSRVLLGFSHLNFRDGGAVQILHTSEDPFAATVAGAIFGVNGPPTLIRSPLYDDPVGVYVLPALAVFFLTGGVLSTLVWDDLSGALTAFALALATAWASVRSWRTDQRRLPASLRQSLGPSGVDS